MDAEALVDRFVAAWSRLDADELAGYFAEDAVYHNIPIMPVSGRAAIRDFIAAFVEPYSGAHFTVHRQAANGNVVLNERTDTFTFADGGTLDILVTGVFEIENGEIRAWRDYFDLTAVTDALAEHAAPATPGNA
ncbi:SgcJ/EcaC family oxidoreductase [Streptomyces sp. SID3343]|uniref:SgcJ/EcaC family oxidoreductase n=1 Tax=Streptomyces sp. SID3343 TaxID=2690260 RepID=UPI00136C1085|nr:SgcJ/EcaC family oxidoreductase [Streptomyces sp. SID3343]MYW02899.1 SgcJ/EcaC family oxidoreductase [Streptomyces sp. SID3343]